MEQVGRIHPTVTDLVEDGSIVDTSFMRNYHYWATQAYSSDRWALIGDAAYALDPLFSNGLAFSTLQIEQVGEMIARDLEGKHDEGYICALDKAVWAPIINSQTAITNWYPSMHDAFLCSLRLHWIEVAYFYMLLPMVVNRCHWQEDRMVLWRALQISNSPYEIPDSILEARAKFDKPSPEHFIYRGKEKVNLRALEKVDDTREIVAQMRAGAALRNQYVQDVLGRLAEVTV